MPLPNGQFKLNCDASVSLDDRGNPQPVVSCLQELYFRMQPILNCGIYIMESGVQEVSRLVRFSDCDQFCCGKGVMSCVKQIKQWTN